MMARDRMMTKKIPQMFGSLDLFRIFASYLYQKLLIYEEIISMDDGRHPYLRTNVDIVCGQYRG